MSLPLRLLLIIAPILLQLYIVVRIKKLKMKAEDSVFWLIFSAVLVIIGIFPGIAISVSNLLGIISPANFVFLVMIALLLGKIFSLSTKVSVLERKLQSLAQDIVVGKNDEK